MKDLISIIMPVKNTSLFLKECIDSIIGQTYARWELIAVNDQSADNSMDILKSYEKLDSRIKVLENNGHGIINALQTGANIANGNFITRMDSDDINEPLKYEQMLGQLKENGRGHIALGQVKYFSNKGVKDGFQKYETWLNTLIGVGNCFDEIYKECVIPSPCWMLHRQDFEDIGGFNSEIYPEDYDLCFRMYKKGLQPMPSNDVLFNWRDYRGRTSRTNPNYNEEGLLGIKCHYFLEIDFDKRKNLVVWGAGRRGKFIANYLIEKEVSFTWVCNNENKIGRDIYGLILQGEPALNQIADKQIIVSVANAEEQEEIKETCQVEGWERYFFC